MPTLFCGVAGRGIFAVVAMMRLKNFAKMKEYNVSIPITGIMYITVKAENEEEAKEKAMDGITIANLEGWEAHEEIVDGNVFCGMMNEMQIEEA